MALPNGNTVSYGYDALGRRASRTQNGIKTDYLYDGADVVADKVGTTVTAEYLNGAGTDEKLRQVTGTGTSLYFVSDHLGSTTALTNASGNVVERINYEAFGAHNQSSSTRYTYTGREDDETTGLMHYRARWYDPAMGRFVSEDPIGLAGGINLYRYVDNNPTNFVDPTGNNPFLKILIGGGSAALVNAGFQLWDISDAKTWRRGWCKPTVPSFDWGKVANASLAGSGASALGVVKEGGFAWKFASGFFGQVGANGYSNAAGWTDVDLLDQSLGNAIGEIIGPAGNRVLTRFFGPASDDGVSKAIDNAVEFCENFAGDFATAFIPNSKKSEPTPSPSYSPPDFSKTPGHLMKNYWNSGLGPHSQHKR